MWRGRETHQGWQWRLPALPVLALALAAVLVSAPHAQADVVVESIRVGFSNSAQNNIFKVGTWTPVWVQLTGTEERFAGTLEVEVPDDDGTPTFFRTPVDVPAKQTISVVTYARPGSRDPNFLVRLRDDRGRAQRLRDSRGRGLGTTADGSSLAQFASMMPDESLILALGNPSGVDQIPSLPGFNADPNPNQGPATASNALTVARLSAGNAGQIPGRWYGYDAAAVVLVDTNDKDVMSALTVRGQALADWVARGGHLVVTVGGNWQSARDSVLGPLLPAVPTGQTRLSLLDLKTLDQFAGASKSIYVPEGPPALVTKLEQVESRGGKVLSAVSDVPLVVRGAHGFGRVTLVGFDVDSKPFTDWPDRSLFWIKALDIRRPAVPTDATNTVRLGGGGRRMYQVGVGDLATQLRSALEQFPGVKLIPFGWVAFFIFLYILLIGPGDYFFLKKVVKRMELTWLTFPLIVISVSLAAYLAAYLVKGKTLRVNKVDIVDVDQASGRARGNTFFNLFSPQNRDYDVSIVPLALDRDPPTATPGESVAAVASRGEPPRPPAGTEVLSTWLGVPEQGFGGMGNSGRMGFSGSGYASSPAGSSETLEGVRVPIWSTKLLTSEWFGPAPELIASDLSPVGTDRLTGTVTNKTGTKLHDAILAFGKQVYSLGDIQPGETIRVELKPDRNLAGLLSSLKNRTVVDPSTPEGRIDRAALALGLMFHDSQRVATGEQAVASDPLHFLDLSGQLALDRPMLVGRVERPASQLALGNAPAPPKVEQTTMLRVILPLKK